MRRKYTKADGELFLFRLFPTTNHNLSAVSKAQGMSSTPELTENARKYPSKSAQCFTHPYLHSRLQSRITVLDRTRINSSRVGEVTVVALGMVAVGAGCSTVALGRKLGLDAAFAALHVGGWHFDGGCWGCITSLRLGGMLRLWLRYLPEERS